jgi:putative nucleotidyltransferase with HDIG domain
MRLLESPDCDGRDVVKVIQTDAVLSAKLLRVCNTAARGYRQPVTTIEQAVISLGFAEVQLIAIALSFGATMSRPLTRYEIDGEAFWEHSLLVAQSSESLVAGAKVLGFDPSVAYTAGLLHDIGKLVLNAVLTPESLTAVRDLVEHQGLSRLEAERQMLGTDHADVGARLLEKWQLPAVLVETVEHHHAPICEPQPTLSVFVHLANGIAHQCGSAPGWAGYALHMDEKAAASVGFGAEQLQFAILVAKEQRRSRSRRRIALPSRNESEPQNPRAHRR